MARRVDSAGKGPVSSRTRKRPVSSLHPVNMTSKRARTRDTEEITMPARASHNRAKRKRSLKGKEKAVSSDEEPGESVVNEAQHAAGYPEASSSQSSPVSTPSGHQSSSATSLESEEITLARLRKELALKDELLQKQAGTFSALQNVLQCQICLEMLWRPYSLTPCGHVACESCLVMWFSQPAEGEQSLEMPLLMPTLKKKTCPTCRTEVRSRPVVAYLIKSALQTVLPCLDPSTYDKYDKQPSQTPDDPWKGIFPDELAQNAAMRRDNIHQAHPEVIIDEEDGGVPRCPVCLHEIYDGICTGCSRLYDGISDDDDNDDIDSNDGGLLWQRLYFPEAVAAGNPAAWTYTDDDHSEDDGPYESSFVDDDEDDATRDFEFDEHDSEFQLADLHSSVRRTGRFRGDRNAPRVLSDEEHVPPLNPEHWQSYLTRAARRHGSVGAEPAPLDADPRGTPRTVEVGNDSEGSDWAPRSRRERLAQSAREERRRNRRNTLIVVSSDEDDGSDHGRMPSYLRALDDDDIIVPPYAPRRSARRRVVNVVTSDNDSSGDDVFEDAVSTGERTATSAGRQSSRYHAGASHSGQSDSERAHGASPIVHGQSRWGNDDEDNTSRHSASGRDVDPQSDNHDSARGSSEEPDSDASDASGVSDDEPSDSSF